MDKKTIIIILIVAILLYSLGIFIFRKPTSTPIEPPLEVELDSLYIVRDSIIKDIDTIYIQIKDVEKKHEETVNAIVNNDVSEDEHFFMHYITKNKSRLDSLYLSTGS